MSIKQQLRFFLTWLASLYFMAAGSSVSAAEMNLARTPLFLGAQIDPNVFFMMDDSGSMDWEILTKDYEYYSDYWSSSSTVGTITSGYFRAYSTGGSCGSGTRNFAYIYRESTNPDNVYNSCSYAQLEANPQAAVRDWRVMNSDMNIMYYDPSATYLPWVGFNNANFNNVRSDPQSTNDGYDDVQDLVGFEYHVWVDNLGYDNDDSGGTVEGPNSVTDGGNEQVDLWDSHVKYVVNSGTVDVTTYTTTFAGVDGSPNCDLTDAQDTPPYKDCFGTTAATVTLNGSDEDPWGRTPNQIRTNIANWYEFARRRSFISKGAVARVITSNDDFRFGYSQINRYDLVFEEVPAEAVEDYDAHNTALLNEMYDFQWRSNGTPLRRGLERVGRYYDDYSGYSYADPIISACQQNYAILFTDGYWNGSSPYTSAIGDEDGDGAFDTVADVAHYFYTEDLSPLPDQVPTTPLDANDAQHMVSFTVAFGVEGNLVDTDDDGYPNPELAENGAWNNGSVNTDSERIDDLWHAAYNSKGFYVSAQSATGVAQAIAAALLDIADRVGSAASVATNTGSLNAGSKLFQARFDSSDWKGQLLAFQISLDGSISENPTWEGGNRLNNQNYDTGREIITWNPEVDNPPGGDVEGAGIPFRFPADYTSPDALTEMNTTQIADLMVNAPFDIATVTPSEISTNQTYGDAVVDYLRGDDSNELIGLNFRLRNSILGDIVNSDPKFVDVPNSRYPDALEAKSYNDFVTDNNARQGVVYVGANDGMVHGFNDDTGDEILAFVPNSVYGNLPELTSSDYEHLYYVDGGPNIIDVWMPNMDDPDSATNGVWRTVLAGGLAAGGQGIYALDVTDPSVFDEASADSLVLWEFDDGDDADLGYTYSKVQMAKMNDGTWAAIFGNGYNNTEADGNASTTGHAVLYIVDVETGEILKKIDTEAGDVATPNGLGTPLLIDIGEDNNVDVDYIYAGDMLGNMWKFDVTDPNTTNWEPAWDSGGLPAPLFTTSANQPITGQPQASFHPDNLEGFLIFFGTGQYLETGDNDAFGQTTQTFYAVWDKNQSGLPGITTADLLAQSITDQYEQDFDTDDDGFTDETYTLRDVSDNLIDWDIHDGWKMDLYPVEIDGVANVDNFGERQVSNPIVRNGRVIFTTLVPSNVECEFGGMSFLMELDFRDGSALEFPAFDLNGDGEYDADDSDASGRASDVGIMPTVSILADDAQDVAFGSGASGDIDVIQLSVGDQSYGRQSWRQLE